ncbi:GNAT family N-acetyltransferase [Catelliglobosispora koreensis]|uniref:GNAT family N-acetyltransferase n=1 Tax=Catelliglobosispora koreensis TaxID=129052 RepID=UPI00036E807E|nr:GNAT family N-acetyltransferase [Catelliglobosispora koreensis]
MTGYVIRTAGPGDVSTLARLRWQFKTETETGSHLPEREFMARCEPWLRARLGGTVQVWVAQTDEGLCGHVFLNLVEKVPSPFSSSGELGYVTNFYVVPRWRNRGVGQALLAAVKTYAEASQLDTLIVWPSERSALLYHRSGFLAPDSLLELPIESATPPQA